jgi:histidyl-tRNA synthetase
MDLSLPKGIHDIQPEEYEIHQKIRSSFEEITKLYNFKLMEPAPIETLAVLRAKSGSAVDEQIYSFKDKADREIGLRFDLTVGMTRYVVTKRGLRPPIKLASYGGVWRYDEPQHARYRWFHQWDIEIFGDSNIESDAEIMDASYNFFQRLGLSDSTLQVGDRRVVEEYIRRSLGIGSEEKLIEMMRALDKVTKKSENELIKEYEVKGVKKDEMKALLEFGRLKGSSDDVIKKLRDFRLRSTEGLESLRDSLKFRGIKNFEYNLSIVRGIDYYTSLVFEVVDKNHPDLGSLCGGGRYDILPRIFGRPEISATGSAGGVERIALSLSRVDHGYSASVYVAYTENELIKNALEILSTLRKEGVKAELGTKGKNLSKQLEEASVRGFRWVVIIGRKELSAGSVTLKDMKERREDRVDLEDIPVRVMKEY